MPRIRGNGRYGVEVVGESFYVSAFESLFGRAKTEEGDERELDAELRLENSNAHDSQAVGVYIRDKKVGNLSRDMARDFRKALKRDGLERWTVFAVGASVYVPHDRGEHYSVSLDLPED